MPDQERAPSPAALHVIRLALLIGVVSFGAVAWFMHDSIASPDNDELSSLLSIVFFVVVVGSAAAMLFVRQRWTNASGPRERATLGIVGWALAEGAALLGAVALLLTGSVLPFVIGVVFMLASFSLFPIEN